jgi:SAM-dependent methyltransferase
LIIVADLPLSQDQSAQPRKRPGEDLEVVREILPNDAMYEFDPSSYFRIGREALDCIQLALDMAEVDAPKHILDFASGAGRVMRYLKAAYPEAALTACDYHMFQAEFCERTFGAKAVAGDEDPTKIQLRGPFDLIWCGSHFGHIDRHRWADFLKLFESVASPGGVLVFTTFGRRIVELLRGGESLLNLTEESAAKVLSDYDTSGFGFHTTRFDGDCVASPSWVCKQLEQVPSLQLLQFREDAWAYQDVVTCVKTGRTAGS